MTDDTTAIDPQSEYSLHDVVAGEMPAAESTEYMGFHVMGQGGGRYHVHLDGHTKSLLDFDASEYDDVLALVDDLNRLVIRRDEHDGDRDARVAWAGKMLTHDETKADDDNYLVVPDPLDDDIGTPAGDESSPTDL